MRARMDVSPLFYRHCITASVTGVPLFLFAVRE
jgi:hypothetical protein